MSSRSMFLYEVCFYMKYDQPCWMSTRCPLQFLFYHLESSNHWSFSSTVNPQVRISKGEAAQLRDLAWGMLGGSSQLVSG